MILGHGGFIPIIDIIDGVALIIDDVIGGKADGIPGNPMNGNPPIGGNPRAAGNVVVMGPAEEEDEEGDKKNGSRRIRAARRCRYQEKSDGA